jgi:hypothetical protein
MRSNVFGSSDEIIMKRTVIALALAGVVLVGRPATARAECMSVQASTSEQLARHKLVFVGDVVEIESVLMTESYRERVHFQVVEAFKGVEVGRVVVDFTPTAESFRFKVGQRTLVYATGQSESYSTQCTPTRATSATDPEVKALRELTPAK